jgi:DNA-binding protein
MTEEKSTKKKATPKPKVAKTENASKSGDNVVFVGKKPVMSYVIACITYFNSGASKITLKARGRAICRAVDTVELLRRAFLKDLQLHNIAICTEEIAREEGQKSNVSAIEITLTKP